VSPVKYELGFYIPEDAIFHSHRRENLKSYVAVRFPTEDVCFVVVLLCPGPLKAGCVGWIAA
jgi:hypothetical protein